MQTSRWIRLAAAVAAAVMVPAAHGEAGVITRINQFLLPGFSTGSMSAPSTVSPNNDDAAAASPNTIATGFPGIFLNAGGFDVIDYEFNVADSGGTTEYFFTTNVLNNTGVPWSNFYFQLGFGTGASFVPVGAGVGLDFDAPGFGPAPTSSVFPLLSREETLLEWAGATITPITSGSPFSVAFSLSIDVPDGLAAINPGGVNRFTLRSAPMAAPVPEPATAALMGVGLALAAIRRRY